MRAAIAIVLTVFAGAAWAEVDPDRDDKLRVAFAGDAMCHGPQINAAYRSKTKSYDFSGVFAPIKALLSEPDIMIANLETTLPGDPKKYRGFPLFGTADSFAAAMKASGVDVLATANNHCVDSFEAGLKRTIETVRKMGFHQLGTYSSADDWKKRRVLMVEKKGFRIAMLNYTYSTNGIPVPEGLVVNMIEEEKIAADLEAARQLKPDAIIVIYHWGWEYNRYPNSRQKHIAQFSFENGADVVLGAHPHVVQPFESRIVTDRFGETKQRVVLYSAGNFISNMQRSHTKGGIVFHVDFVRNPDPKHPQKLLFHDIGFQSTWVYRGYSGGVRKYQLLPVDEHLAGRSKVSVPSYELSRMKQHASSNAALLKSGAASVEKLGINLAGKGPVQGPLPPVVVVAGVTETDEKKMAAAAKVVAVADVGGPTDKQKKAAGPAPVSPPEDPGDFQPGGAIEVTLELLAKPGDDGSAISSGNVLGLFDYKVVRVTRGAYPLKTIRVANGYAINGRLSNSARRPLGTTVHMELVPWSTYPGLQNWKLLGDATEEEKRIIYTPTL